MNGMLVSNWACKVDGDVKEIDRGVAMTGSTAVYPLIYRGWEKEDRRNQFPFQKLIERWKLCYSIKDRKDERGALMKRA